MENYNAYTKVDGKLVSISQNQSSDVTKTYVDEQLSTKANVSELDAYVKTEELTTLVGDTDVSEFGNTITESIFNLGKYVSDGKNLVATAITDKGVATETTATFEELATNIGKIPVGGATPKAKLIIETDIESLTPIHDSYTVSIYNTTTQDTMYGNISSTKNAEFNIETPGMYYIRAASDPDTYLFYANISPGAILNNQEVIRKIIPYTDTGFADLTLSGIAEFIALHYQDKLDIRDHWNIGDESVAIPSGSVTPEAITTSSPVTIPEFHLTILGFELDELTDPVGTHTKAAVSLLANANFSGVYSLALGDGTSNIGSSGNFGKYSTSVIRQYLNKDISKYIQSLGLPLKSVIKRTNERTQYVTTSSTANKEFVISETNDLIFLLSVFEISTAFQTSLDFNGLIMPENVIQYPYFTTKSFIQNFKLGFILREWSQHFSSASSVSNYIMDLVKSSSLSLPYIYYEITSSQKATDFTGGSKTINGIAMCL